MSEEEDKRYFFNFSFFKIDPKWRWMADLAKEESARELENVLENLPIKIRTYSTLGLRDDADLTNATALTLPRIGFELNGIEYDGDRKLNKLAKVKKLKGTKVISPIIGTAYIAPEPGGKKFVEVGKKIKKGDTVMIVEAMKTMNHVPSPINGTIKKICIEDGQPVEFGQVLVLLD